MSEKKCTECGKGQFFTRTKKDRSKTVYCAACQTPVHAKITGPAEMKIPGRLETKEKEKEYEAR